MPLDRTGWVELNHDEDQLQRLQQGILDILKDVPPEVCGLVIASATAQKIVSFNIDAEFSVEWIKETTLEVISDLLKGV